MMGTLRDAMRRRVGTLLLDGFFQGLTTLLKLHPAARPARHGVEVIRDIPYLSDGTTQHLLDIYRPVQSDGPLPVVLYVHGGGFRILSKDTHGVMGLTFARRRFVVLNINYRLAPRHPFPAALEDAADALRWAVANASQYGGDPSRLVLAGESAGANLVTTLALCCCYNRDEPVARSVRATGCVPVAVLPACGLLQVTDPGRFARGKRLAAWLLDRIELTSQQYLGDAPPGPALELADPLVVLEQGAAPDRPLPPFLAQVGTRDPLLDDTRRLKAALDRLGTPCEARYYEGQPHAFHAMIWRRQAKLAWRDTYAFLERHVPR